MATISTPSKTIRKGNSNMLPKLLTTEQLLESILNEGPNSAIGARQSNEIIPSNRKPIEEIEDIFSKEKSSGAIDYRIRQLSHSSRLLLHTCPRKFQLEKLRISGANESTDTKITFAFGHAVGLGIAKILQGMSIEETYFDMFLNWSEDLLEEDTKRNKSFWYAMLAIDKLYHMRKSGLLAEYEVVVINGKPAEELSFNISFPDNFNYRGYVDLILRNTETGKLVILENKTGSGAWNGAKYKNSAQALGYSVILDYIDTNLSDYMVLYMYYDTKSLEFTVEAFAQSMLSRARWIREVLLDIEIIKSYSQEDIFPMYGENCYDFYRECKYYGVCTLATESLKKPLAIENIDDKLYQYNLSLEQLLDTQIGKIDIY